MSDIGWIGSPESFCEGRWDDGRPKGWPTLQLRIRGQAFDVYCDHPTDVTLDGYGLPVIQGRTVTRAELERGWSETARTVTPESFRAA